MSVTRIQVLLLHQCLQRQAQYPQAEQRSRATIPSGFTIFVPTGRKASLFEHALLEKPTVKDGPGRFGSTRSFKPSVDLFPQQGEVDGLGQ